MLLTPRQLYSFDAEANSVKNFYNSDLASRGKFDQETQLWTRYW